MKKGYCVNTNGGSFQELHMITRSFIWGLIMKQGYYVSTNVVYHYLCLHGKYLEYFKGVLFLI